MIIGGKDTYEVQITNKKGELLASITDDNVIIHKSVEVELIHDVTKVSKKEK